MSITERIIELMVNDYDKDPAELSAQTKFDELAFDSLDVAEMVMTLEDEYNVAIEMSEAIKTIGDLAAAIEEKKA